MPRQISAQDHLAWMWISWVRKYKLSRDVLQQVYDKSTDTRMKEQSLLALHYTKPVAPAPYPTINPSSPKQRDTANAYLCDTAALSTEQRHWLELFLSDLKHSRWGLS